MICTSGSIDPQAMFAWPLAIVETTRRRERPTGFCPPASHARRSCRPALRLQRIEIHHSSAAGYRPDRKIPVLGRRAIALVDRGVAAAM